MSRELIEELKNVLANVEATRAELDEYIPALRKTIALLTKAQANTSEMAEVAGATVVHEITAKQPEPRLPAEQVAEFRPTGPVQAAIRDWAQARPGAFTRADVALAVKCNVTYASAVLQRLCDLHLIRRAGRGVYYYMGSAAQAATKEARAHPGDTLARFLQAHNQATMQDMVEALGDRKMVGNAVQRLKAKGLIKRVAYGVYAWRVKKRQTSFLADKMALE